MNGNTPSRAPQVLVSYEQLDQALDCLEKAVTDLASKLVSVSRKDDTIKDIMKQVEETNLAPLARRLTNTTGKVQTVTAVVQAMTSLIEV
jgi:hypothetical protein